MSWHKISKALVEKSPVNWAKSEKEKDLCIYAVELFLSNIFNFALIFCLCMFFHIQREVLVFLLFYCPIRYFAGGGHAPNHVLCITCFYLYMHGSISFAKWLLANTGPLIPVFVSFILLCCCLLINMQYAACHKDKQLKEKHLYLVFAFLFLDIIVIAVFLFSELYPLVLTAILAIMLESIMLLPCFYKKPAYVRQ